MNPSATLTLARDGGLVVARVAGELDLASMPGIRARLFDAISNDDEIVVLDLTELTYIDSAGISMAFELAAELRRHNQALHAVLSRDAQPWRTLHVAGAQSLMPFHESLDDATASIAANRA